MARFIRIIAAVFSVVSLVVLHLGFSYILPYPFSKINILFVGLVLLILWWESGLIVWLAFFTHFFIELYATTPFGVVLYSSTLSILLSYWLYKTIFTNRSWFSAISVSFLSIFIYRFLYLLILLFLKTANIAPFISWRYIFLNVFWELALTTAVLSILYFIISRFSKKLNSAIIQSSPFKI